MGWVRAGEFFLRRKKLSMDNLKSQTLHKLLEWSGVIRLVLNANVEAILR
jgi:hypothetical protein